MSIRIRGEDFNSSIEIIRDERETFEDFCTRCNTEVNVRINEIKAGVKSLIKRV